jgi:glycosyltransferase involved in cell wall biosynthesis
MRIAQVAPLYESVPPHFYGGTERVVSWLTEELVAQGHDVTLFASGDSVTKARLAPGRPRSIRMDPDCVDPIVHHVVMLEHVMKRVSDFDIIHFHLDYLHFPLSRRSGIRQVSTLHGRLDSPDLVPLYRDFHDMPLISISRKQRAPLPWVNWVGNVYHGLPADFLPFHPLPGEYLAFLGRLSPEKRPDRAIEIAVRSGMPLKIAAKIDKIDRDYFEAKIKPLLNTPNVEFVGEIGDAQKAEFLGNAFALLFPIDWPEPFGITLIEAMACGTPTIAFNHGSVAEILTDGVNGCIVESVDEAVRAVASVSRINRKCCRLAFEERFTSERMASEYLKIYGRLTRTTHLRGGLGSQPLQSALEKTPSVS